MRRRKLGHAWPPRRPWARSPMESRAQQDLRHANRLVEIGDFLNAAFLYEKLARKVHDLGRPRQAGHLYVQAARARVLAGQLQPGLDVLKQGLSTFAQAGLWEAFDRVGNRVVAELRQQEQEQAVEAMVRWLDLTRQSRPAASVLAAEKGPIQWNLPLKCPACGATVRPDEVEWLDERRAVCDYCGSMLAA